MNKKNENEMIIENELINQTPIENEVINHEKPAGDAEPIIEIESSGDAEPIIEAELDENFEPQKIGVPDFQKTQFIERIYGRFIKQIPFLKEELEKIFEPEEPLSIEVFIEYLQAADPKLWILQRFVIAKKIDYGQMDPIKMMELGVIPSPDTTTVIDLTTKIKSTIVEIKNNGFHYPISKLWDPELADWDLTTDFYNQLEDFATRKTQTTKQNLIVTKFERLCEVLNELAGLGILRPDNGKAELDLLDDLISINKFYKTNPLKKELGATVLEAFTVDPYIFHKHRLQRFRLKGTAGIQKSEFSNRDKIFEI